jgi:hypothetical protein
LTTLSSSRPPDTRWKVAAICAASVGEIVSGRNATMNLSLLVSEASAAVVIHASSHQVPVGVSTDSNPSRSAARATSAR